MQQTFAAGEQAFAKDLHVVRVVAAEQLSRVFLEPAKSRNAAFLAIEDGCLGGRGGARQSGLVFPQGMAALQVALDTRQVADGQRLAQMGRGEAVDLNADKTGRRARARRVQRSLRKGKYFMRVVNLKQALEQGIPPHASSPVPAGGSDSAGNTGRCPERSPGGLQVRRLPLPLRLPPGLGYILMHAAAAGGDFADGVHRLHSRATRPKTAYPYPPGVVLRWSRKSLSATLMKNWEVALSTAWVRAMARVPRVFFRPFAASFLIGPRVFFASISGVIPPPWIMKLSITR